LLCIVENPKSIPTFVLSILTQFLKSLIMDTKKFISQIVDFLNVMFNVETTKKRKVVRMTVDQLRDFLLNWNKSWGAQPASIQYVTEPALVAEGKEKFGKVVKFGAVQAMLAYNYEDNVNAQRKREGKAETFESEALWNGYGEVLNPCIAKRKVTKTRQKNGEKFKVETGEVIFYLRYRYLKGMKALHFDAAMNFLPKALIQPFFKPYYAPKKQDVDKAIDARTLKLENIRRLRFKRMEIQVIPA